MTEWQGMEPVPDDGSLNFRRHKRLASRNAPRRLLSPARLSGPGIPRGAYVDAPFR